jgi:inhibitor of KinA sporulation pathway (predicted exonuclease)
MGRLTFSVEKPLALMLSKRAKRRLSATQRAKAHACPGPLSAAYIVVVDFECTCERGVGSHYAHEIVEWPAVLVATSDGSVVDEFHAYVKPAENATLSAFCTELTGIEQATVDAAQPLAAVLNDFNAWLDSHGLHFQPLDADVAEEEEATVVAVAARDAGGKGSQKQFLSALEGEGGEDKAGGTVLASSTVSASPAAPLKTFQLCTDGPWDLKYFLAAECVRKGGSLADAHAASPHFMRWCNLRWLHAAYYNKPRMGLKGTLAFHQMTFEGRPHR